jgi:hypothetical protein
MIISRIAEFSEMLSQAQNGKLHEMSFLSKGSNTKRFSVDILGNRSFYNSEGVNLPKILTDYLQGDLTLSVQPVQREPDWKNSRMDFKDIVWITMKRIPDEKIAPLFDHADDVWVMRNKVRQAKLTYVAFDKVDNYVLLYFYYRPKLISAFSKDFTSFSNPSLLYHSLSCLSMTGFVDMFRDYKTVFWLSMATAAPAEPARTATQSESLTIDALKAEKAKEDQLKALQQKAQDILLQQKAEGISAAAKPPIAFISKNTNAAKATGLSKLLNAIKKM